MTTEPSGRYLASNLRVESDIPVAGTSSITASRIHNCNANVAVFSAKSWPLAALDTGERSSRTIHFGGWPDGFQDFARHVAYVLINRGNPESLVEQFGTRAEPWLSGSTIVLTLLRLRAQVIWLTSEWSDAHPETPVTSPADLDVHHLDDLKNWLERRHPDATVLARNLWDVVRIWHLSPLLPETCRWPAPAWEKHGWRPKQRKEDNKTLSINESTYGPLLEWARAFVDAFATDILEARIHYLERIAVVQSAEAGMTAGKWIDSYETNGRALPPRPATSGGRPGNGVGWHVLEYRHGVSVARFSSAFTGPRRPSIKISDDIAETALAVSVAGQFHGRQWIPFIGVYDMTYAGAGKRSSDGGPLLAHLRTACLILTAAFTGMRPEEVLNLKHGSALAPVTREGGSRLQLIQGRVFKGVGRSDDGAPREPDSAVWATVPVVATAIRTMEQINESLGRSDGLLFSECGSVPVYTRTAAGWIQSFIDFVNTRLVPLTASPDAFTITDDADGRITLTRFRRTLAWFLRHRPNGDVTTAIQYQHLGVAISEGYAGTKASGMPDLLLEEDWEHRKDTIREIGDLLAAGHGVSGPAAEHVIEAAQQLPRQLLPADERRLRKDKSFPVYDNPSAIAICFYREENALCGKLQQSGKDTQPDLLGCVDGCLNCARTDDHLRKLSREVLALRDQAELAALPMAQSMLDQADRKERIVIEFGPTRLILTGDQSAHKSEVEGLPGH